MAASFLAILVWAAILSIPMMLFCGRLTGLGQMLNSRFVESVIGWRQ